METQLLWRVVVGSKLWGRSRPDSDTDYFCAYAIPTRDILTGVNKGGGANFVHDVEGKRDEQRHEIGRWVDELAKGNYNYVEALFSTLPEYTTMPKVNRLGPSVEWDWLTQFREAYPRSKAILGSAYGRSHSMLSDAQKKPEKAAKYLRSIVETAAFIDRWHFGWSGRQLTKPITDQEFTAESAMKSLDSAIANIKASNLPDRPDMAAVRELLYLLRMEMLEP